MAYVTTTIVAFVVAVALILALRPIAATVGLVDRPGERKSHTGEIPVIGGLAMFGGLLVAMAAGGRLGHNGQVVLVAAAMMVVVGAVDDRFEIHPLARLVTHLLAATALASGTGFVVGDLGDLLGAGEVRLGPLALPFTVVACIALINGFNMLDGLDGLAGGAALAAFLGLALIASGADAPGSLLISSGLAGALAGFLVFNLPANYNRRMRTFMGDAGSTLLGFVLACVSLILVQPGKADLPPVIVLWLMPLPIFELFASTGRRLVLGTSPLRADRGHFHYCLLEAGFSVRLIFAGYFVLSIGSAIFAVMAYRAGIAEPVLFAGFILFFLTWLLLVRNSASIARLLPLKLRRDLSNLQY